MSPAAIFEGSLECVAETVGDPTQLVYARLFEIYPDMEKLFVMDTDGGARGNMLTQALTCGADLLGENSFATAFIAAERLNHEGYDISDDVFEGFFATLHDVFRENTGTQWTTEMEAVWNTLREKVQKARL